MFKYLRTKLSTVIRARFVHIKLTSDCIKIFSRKLEDCVTGFVFTYRSV